MTIADFFAVAFVAVPMGMGALLCLVMLAKMILEVWRSD